MRKLVLTVVCALVVSAWAQEETGLVAQYKQEIRANPRLSLPHFRLGKIYFQQHQYQEAGNELRDAIIGDLKPRWVEVWARVTLGKIFDLTGQRERAINEYRQAQSTKDNTRGALDEAELYLTTPYSWNK